MKVTVIIGYYKKINYLELILQGLAQQTFEDFEVIIAEDNNELITLDFISTYQKKVSFPLKVVQQEDTGFRKNRILNEAVSQSAGETLIFFDGDCIPHKECIKEHYINSAEKVILSGRRVMLSKSITNQLLQANSFKPISYFKLLLSGSKHIEESVYLPYYWIPKKHKRGLLGCNFSIQKKSLEEINGFDEDYEKAGVGEDSDIEWRLLKLGYTIVPIKFKAIVYHLFHDSNYLESDVQFNTIIMNKKIKDNITFCFNGLNNHAQQ